MADLYIGIMSGTSVDGVDGVVVSFGKSGVTIHDYVHEEFSDVTRKSVSILAKDPSKNKDIADSLENYVSNVYAYCSLLLVEKLGTLNIRAIGCHGQTISHRPDADPPFSWQVCDGKAIADKTGYPVVVDFRSADMRNGGQGAPLAPLFHEHVFQKFKEPVAVVNIGGISNATYIPADSNEEIMGFDTGPGNALSDLWTRKYKKTDYDKDGEWALSVEPNDELVKSLLEDPYFEIAPPKSLDASYFTIEWLLSALKKAGFGYIYSKKRTNVQSAIAAFTAESIWLGIEKWMPPVKKIYVCGGGAYNKAIMNRLRKVSKLEVVTTDVVGIPPNLMEATVFAWLAKQRLEGVLSNVPPVTGAKCKVLLGEVVYPSEFSRTAPPKKAGPIKLKTRVDSPCWKYKK